jgi:hypothetical protein
MAKATHAENARTHVVLVFDSTLFGFALAQVRANLKGCVAQKTEPELLGVRHHPLGQFLGRISTPPPLPGGTAVRSTIGPCFFSRRDEQPWQCSHHDDRANGIIPFLVLFLRPLVWRSVRHLAALAFPDRRFLTLRIVRILPLCFFFAFRVDLDKSDYRHRLNLVRFFE